MLFRSFGDPLFVRTRQGMTPTERARAMLDAVTSGLGQIDRAIEERPTFDPATARRSFSIVGDDYTQLVLLPALCDRLAHEAPGVDLAVLAPREADAAAGALDAGRVDFIVAGRTFEGAGLVRKHLFKETFACVIRKDHPAARRGLTPEAYASARHVVIAPTGRPGSFVDALLAERGLSRRTALRIPHFLVAPFVLARTDLVLTAPRRLAEALAERQGLRVLDPPIPMPGFSVSLYWHEGTREDAGHRFLREHIVRAADSG